MFCANQKFHMNGDSDDLLRLTLEFALKASGYYNTAERELRGCEPQPQAYTIDPQNGIILFWHDGVDGTTVIPKEMRNMDSVFALIRGFLSSKEAKQRYRALREEWDESGDY